MNGVSLRQYPTMSHHFSNFHISYNSHPIQHGGHHLKITKANYYQQVMGEKNTCNGLRGK
jgi:hypothetical protein